MHQSMKCFGKGYLDFVPWVSLSQIQNIFSPKKGSGRTERDATKKAEVNSASSPVNLGFEERTNLRFPA